MSEAPGARKVAIVLVVAVADNDVIGRDGGMPWRLKSDMQHFRRLTMNRPIVMGRKTWLSLPRRPLPGRTNIVVTRDPDFVAEGALVVPSVDAALEVARADALRRGTDAIMVIGGAEIFALTMARADRLEVTRVHARPDGDVHMLPVDPALWREVARSEHAPGPEDDAGFTIFTYERN